MKSIELLAPAGDLEKLKIAVEYGADAVYFGGSMFSLRAGADNLNLEEIREGVELAHKRNVNCYMAVNIFARNEDIVPLRDYLSQVKDIPIDAFILSDPGVADVVGEMIPEAELHLSTQANTTNHAAANFWYRQGIKRIVLARELSIDEIREIRQNVPTDLEFEAFAQGAMCISYSGRCLLSNFMTGRDSNRGVCAHPCRWRYKLVEEQRQGEYYPIEEDERGTYILNSKDLSMLEHIPELVEAGVSSLKIEGRMKSAFYVATVVRAYRFAIDAYLKDPCNYKTDPMWMEELQKASHRDFTTGFYFDRDSREDQNYETGGYNRNYSFTGIVREYDHETMTAVVEQRNKMNLGDEIEIFGPGEKHFTQRLSSLRNELGENVDSAPHPQQILQIKMDKPVKENYILRKRIR